MNTLRRFYWGETRVDFVGRAKVWFSISAVVLLISILAFFVRGLNLSIEFEGGTAWIIPGSSLTTEQASEVVGSFDVGSTTVQEVGDDIRLEARSVEPAQAEEISLALAEAARVPVDSISKVSVGPSWGAEVSRKAFQGFVVFLIAVAIYIAIRFEAKMAVTAIGEMFHDLIVTVGIYAIGGFQVSPATVIGVLTMLGYSLYDAVVVFDKIRENGPMLASGKFTYSDLVNRSMNQTLTRSMATSITSILPAASLLFVGSVLLSAVTLRDLALALFVGIASGSYSSIFIAAPVLAKWKEREPRYRQLRAKLEAKQTRNRSRQAKQAVAAVGAEAPGRKPVVARRGHSDSVPTDAPSGAAVATSDETPAPKPSKTPSKPKTASKPARRHGRATPVSRKRRRS